MSKYGETPIQISLVTTLDLNPKLMKILNGGNL
jgi:hypothetical protein